MIKSSNLWIVTTIDRITWFLLPAIFALFNFLYWPYLLNPYSKQLELEMI